MGRPKDKFCWDYVDRLADGKLSCKFCNKEFKGGASRIRKHLSGEGGEIGPCDEVPPDIREDALKESVMKRRRSMSLGEDCDGVCIVETRETPNSNLNVIPPFQVSSFHNWSFDTVNVIEREETNDDSRANGVTSTSNSFDIAQFLRYSPSSTFNNVNVFDRNEIGYSLAVPMTTENITFPVSSSSYLDVGDSGSNNVREEEVVDALVMFLMSINVSVDVIKGSHFRTLLNKVAKSGFPQCLLEDNSTIIQKSVWNLEHDVIQHMQMVIESWKTTGCTLIVYDLNEGKTKLVLGFYCPKGFLFGELMHVDAESLKVKIKVMDNHVLSLHMDNVAKHIFHDPCISTCHYQGCQSTIPFHTYMDVLDLLDEETHDLCLECKVQQFWSKIRQSSDLIQDLINKSEKVYEFLVQSSMNGRLLYKTILEHKRVGQAVTGDHATSSFSRLRSIMELKQEVRRLRHDERRCLTMGNDVKEIIKDKNFWCDGEELLEALTPLLRISDFMDTLVPTVGYLYVAIDKANRVLRTYCDRNVSKYQPILKCLENWIEESTCFTRQQTAAYLSPTYVLSEEIIGNFELSDAVKFDLQSIVGGEERDAIVAELKVYTIKAHNPFACIPRFECRTIHPVKLWLKYGGKFPILQKCAIKLLNQPVSCMCNQVKKNMSKIQGSDNNLLRLNYTMMQEFTKLGDNIYKHIPF